MVAVAGLLLLSAALLGHWTPLQAQEGEAAAPEATGASGVTIRLDDLVGLITYSIVDRFDVQLANLDAATTYEVVVSSSNAAALGIGGCGVATQRATVTGAMSRNVEFRVFACGLGAGTVTAALRAAGASRAAVMVSQGVTVEPIPDWVPADERPVRGAAGAVAQVGTPTFVRNPRFEQIMTTSVVAKWDTPTGDGGEDLSGYGLLFWHKDEEHPSYRDDVLVKGLIPREHTYTGLQHDATYKFRIHACNETPACGWWTNPPLEVTTKRAPTPDPPHTIKFTNIAATSVRVTWSIAANRGGVPLTGIDLKYWPYDPANPDSETGARTHPADDGNDRGETLTGLAASTEYELKMRACNGTNDSHCSRWSADHRFTTTAGTTPMPAPPPPADPTVPTNLDVVPQFDADDRFAAVTWSPATGAAGYIVEVRPVGSTSDDDWQRSNGTSFQEGSGTATRRGLRLDLEGFVRGGFRNESAFELQVRSITGSDRQGNDVLSEPSQTIIIIDTPIRTANGRDGRAALTWDPVTDIIGSAYDGGSYFLRYRKFRGDHKSPYWNPASEGFEPVKETPIGQFESTSHTITDVDTDDVYAIQLRYVRRDGDDADGTDDALVVFAVRDVYVWPSTQIPDAGARVGSYPLNYRLNNRRYESLPTSTYEYRLCTDTFAPDTSDGDPGWHAFIDHAFNQWSVATGALVRFLRETNPCRNYIPVAQALMPAVKRAMGPSNALSDAELQAYLEGFVRQARYSHVLRDAVMRQALQLDPDQVVSEVFMYHKNTDPRIFEVSKNVAYRSLCGEEEEDAVACVFLRSTIEHPTRGWIRDMAPRKHNAFETIHDDGTTRYSPELPDVALEKCRASQGYIFQRNYATLVHEAGHALGISGGNDGVGQGRFHPSDALGSQSVMTSEKRNLCAPTRLDVMAIYAHYH